MPSKLKDLRGLPREDRERVRFGEPAPVVSAEGVIVQCACGETMVWDSERGIHFCQGCGQVDDSERERAHPGKFIPVRRLPPRADRALPAFGFTTITVYGKDWREE